MEQLAALTLVLVAAALSFDAGFWLRVAHERRRWRRIAAREPQAWPGVRVIVCLKGALPRLRETVRALEDQDYPGDWGVTFVTEASADDDDEAAAALAAALRGAHRSDHVVAGRVLESDRRRAQKNHNLLGGIEESERRHGLPAVWAFLDGDLLPRPEWLREMVRPLATGAGEATTSFHGVEPRSGRVVEWLHLLLETSQSLALLVCRGATWGGSAAIRAETFRRCRLAELWGRAVVDDVSMSRALKGERLRVVPVPRFLVRSRGAIDDYGRLVRWLGRQYFFVKIYLPSRFRMLWTKSCLNLAVLWLGAFHGGWRLLDGAWPAGAVAGWAAVLGAALVVASTSASRTALPSRVPWPAWLAANLAFAVTNVLACADATRRRRSLTWRDLTYELERDGRVAIVSPARSHEPAPVGAAEIRGEARTEAAEEVVPGEVAA